MPDKETILVIDDNEDDRFTYRRALQAGMLDVRIVEREDGEDCLAAIAAEKPACILLDYSLPGRNGIEVLKRIRSKYPFIPVLILTGQGNEILAVAAMREGAQHYISKGSITPELLQRGIRVAIEHCNMQEHIHEQHAALELFTRALAHDLKEPMRTIRSFLDLIARPDLPPEKSSKYFNYIRQAAERMAGLIDTVYFYMRLDTAGKAVEQELCDCRQALADAQGNLATLIEETGAHITASSLPELTANRAQLTQLLQNLIANALHYCNQQIPHIHVCAERAENNWLFRVSDNGPGIAPEYADKIFQPFKRLSHHHSDGLGLGLAICKKIAEYHGGRIWYEKAQPQGACFCFTLNGEVSPPAAINVTASRAPRLEEEKIANILIVEDSEADIELVRFVLLEEEKLRCNLLISNDGQEALGRLEQSCAPDLILLDINMPVMDGFELLSSIRAREDICGIPVIICSTSAYDRDIDRAKKLGAVGYLVKPLDPEKFLALVAGLPKLRVRQEGGMRSLVAA